MSYLFGDYLGYNSLSYIKPNKTRKQPIIGLITPNKILVSSDDQYVLLKQMNEWLLVFIEEKPSVTYLGKIFLKQ